MDQFPEDFNRIQIEQEMGKNQQELLRHTRKNFYERSIEAKNNCESVLVLEFPEKLWHIHRRQITEEILNAFVEIDVKNCNDKPVTLAIVNKEKIPNEIKSVTIKFKTL